MIRLFQKLILFLPIIGILIGFNYFIDPANLFKSLEYEKGISQILLQKKNVVNVADYDERILQRFYVNGLSNKKDIVVLGSSRSMQIGAELFPGKELFNNSVSGATIEDYAAIYQLYRRKGLMPKILILGLDPWVLNKNNGQYRWQSLKLEYADIAKIISHSKEYFQIDNIFFRKYAEVLSPAYFQQSILIFKGNLSSSRVKKDKYFATDSQDSDYAVKLSDGSLIYDKKDRTRIIQEVNQAAISYAREKPVYSLGNFDKLNLSAMQSLEKFIDLIMSDKVAVVFFLPPYHPATYKILSTSEQYKIITQVQQYLTSLAVNKGIKVFGSYNPNECLLNEYDFYDGMHIKREAHGKIFKQF